MIKLENVTFSYSNQKDVPSLKDIRLSIQEGEFVVLCGESGCGKTTLTRVVNGLIPFYYDGCLRGKVLIDGKDVTSLKMHELAETVGSVFQNPRSQFFAINTTSELAFHCENMSVDRDSIMHRIIDSVDDFGIARLLDRNIFHLSGGEKQKIACASVHCASTRICVLDEPSSNLDLSSIEQLRKVLLLWKKLGKTVVISEHRLHYLQGLADRFVYMNNGQVEQILSAREMKSLPPNRIAAMGLRSLGDGIVKREFVNSEVMNETITLRNFSFSHKKAKPLFHFAKTSLPLKSVIAVIGKNGVGKTTFARCLCGLEKKSRGAVEIGGINHNAAQRLKKCYIVMQDVNHQLFTECVTEEVFLSMENADIVKTDYILEGLDLLFAKDLHPMSLSGGQKQRVAIAGAIVSEKQIVIFDEPTSGLDMKHMKRVGKMISSLENQGKTVFIVTHDPDLIAECCTHILHFKGEVEPELYRLDDFGIVKVNDFFGNKDGVNANEKTG